MALVGFFAGQHIIDDTRTKPEKLTTPHQTSLLISLLESGGFQPLFDTISYRRHSRTALAQPVVSCHCSNRLLLDRVYAQSSSLAVSCCLCCGF